MPDLRYGLRVLMSKPGFTAIALITLALGIGANTAIFTVVNAVLWQRLPYQDPERLVIVWETIPKIGLTENTPAPFNYTAWREQSQVFEQLAAWQIQLANLTGAGEPEQLPGQRVSASFFPLLIGAGLMLRSFRRLNQVDMGFESQNLLTLRVSLPAAKYPDAEKRRAFFDQLLPRLAALPGVEAVGAISGLPVSFQGGGATFQIEGRAEPNHTTPMTTYRIVSPDYFRTKRIPLVAGRVFTAQDREGTEPVAVISESLARVSWPNEDPIGKRVRWGAANGPQMTIVGVVRDVKLHQLTQVKPQLYMPSAQAPFQPYEIALRTKTQPLGLAAAVRYEVWGVDKDMPLANLRTMDQMLADSITRERFNLLLLAVFAGLALTLALVGIYGVMSYAVAQSTREIGIRLALGARPRDVLKLVIGQGLVLTLLGVVIGVAGAFGLTRLMTRLLYGVTATDPLTFAGVSVLLVAVALFASYLPARRATKVDPIVALRYE